MESFQKATNSLGAADIAALKARSACRSVTLLCFDRVVMVEVEVGEIKELTWSKEIWRIRVVNTRKTDCSCAMEKKSSPKMIGIVMAKTPLIYLY